ncbi:MAG: murein biosynthesis integral membrane protein MurJ [Deltaproteobacteria bacterium]|nr:murein biosynthesis integral membrane protein MurJ [Deltaproteobacteria bacterium]MBW2081494.1 murein biosynthesis integral membrane protein MurJ [Deltaproteobacteria bacterium]
MSEKNNRVSQQNSEQVTRAAGIVGFFTFLSRILGLIRDMVIAALFGSGMIADAFFVAFRIPNLLRRLFAEGSLTIAFIPVFTEYLNKKNRTEALELARVTLTILSVILVIVSVAGVLLAPWIVRIQAFGFGGSGTKYELTVFLTRITFPYILLISIVAFFMGVLNSLKRFAAPAAAPIFLNVGIIAGAVFISPHLKEPIVGVAIGVIIGGILQVLLQLPWAKKEGLSLWPVWNPGHPALKRIGVLMLPAVFGSAVYQLNQFIGTLLASFLPEGSISWLYYADRIVQFPLGIFGIAISTAALPTLSEHVALENLTEFSDTLSHSLRMVFFITIPALVGLLVLGEPIVKLIYQRGAFGAYAASMTYKALVFYSVGLWAFSGIRVMVSAFYAMQDTKTPVMVAVCALFANVVLSLSLMGPMKHAGLALALSCASGFQFLLLVIALKKKTPQVSLRPVASSGIKIVFASFVMGTCLYWIQQKWAAQYLCQGILYLLADVALMIVAGAVLYFALARLMGCAELGSFLAILRPRGKKLSPTGSGHK